MCDIHYITTFELARDLVQIAKSLTCAAI